jgi:spermidine synthase
MEALGRHILVEFYNCSPDLMNDVVHIEKSMVEAAETAGATVINSTFHHFSPYGVSGVVVIQESHLAIHTWPEFGYAAVDLFTCGDSVNPWVSYQYLEKALKPATVLLWSAAAARWACSIVKISISMPCAMFRQNRSTIR